MTAQPLSEPTQSALRFEAFGGPEVLVSQELALPSPARGEVRVRVEASSVQFTDTMIRRGIYPDLRDKPPITPGYDFVGIVDAVGDGVTSVSIGDRVADLCVIGGNARYIVRPATSLLPVPLTVDAAEATTLVLSWVTAQQALFRTGELTAGERVLLIGGGGAVGLAAAALAVLRGAEVYATASDRHHMRLRDLGVTPLPRDGWQEEIARLGGVDVVLDGICADNFRSPFRALRPGGRLVAIGASAAAARGSMLHAAKGWLSLPLWNLLPNGRAARIYSITAERKKHPDWFAQDLAALFELLQSGDIHPIVTERLTMSEVVDAHRRLEEGGISGKLVLVPD